MPISWETVEKRLRQEKKQGLIELMKLLHQSNDDVRNFLHARYAASPKTAVRVAPYRRRIKTGFNPAMWDFDLMQKAVDDYRLSSNNDSKGTAELLLTAMETAASVAQNYNIHDAEFYGEIFPFAEAYDGVLYDHPDLIQTKRLYIVYDAVVTELGAEEMVEILSRLLGEEEE